ncbi:hypothetical protein [Burkholderia ambifaria]|uniref:hypothetical protein n=1 Tax=Burkholderia ambifaria TaxID=152480 RepID=UPI001590944C|nr:hypothetical protein [Burkholderia ambifaria]
MHLFHHQQWLRSAQGTNLDHVIARIRTENPAVFHVEKTTRTDKETLSGRVFFDQPIRKEPCRGFVMLRELRTNSAA